MVSSSPLWVYCEQRLVGELIEDTQQRLSFRYAPGWLDDPAAFPISLSLPLGEHRFDSRRSHPFFSNLLPEGLVRQRICVERQISVDNDVALLRAIGGDCAGALSVTLGEPATRDDHYEKIDEDSLARWADGSELALPSLSGRNGVRLSLAGAQDKLPVKVDDDGIWLPLGNSPSTHLLKFTSDRFAHLVSNEVFVTRLGRNAGLNVVEVDLHATDKGPIAVVARYDRQIDGHLVTRLHQEDICQALGIPPARKYEKEGGPSLQQCIEVAKAHFNQPATAVDALLRWAVFNVVAGNSDAHGKNASLLLGTSGVMLAPFYDLVSTRAYTQLDRSLAMSVAGRFDPDTLSASHWLAEARSLQVRPKTVLETARQVAEATVRALDRTADEFGSLYGYSEVLALIPPAVRKRAKRLLRSLSTAEHKKVSSRASNGSPGQGAPTKEYS